MECVSPRPQRLREGGLCAYVRSRSGVGPSDGRLVVPASVELGVYVALGQVEESR